MHFEIRVLTCAKKENKINLGYAFSKRLYIVLFQKVILGLMYDGIKKIKT